MKVIVAGGRDFKNYKLLCEKLDAILGYQTTASLEIVSGGASGADSLGETYARDRGIKVKVFHADWEKHGKSAGPKRNEEMAIYADACIVFWDGQSSGTKNMIANSNRHHLKLRVIYY